MSAAADYRLQSFYEESAAEYQAIGRRRYADARAATDPRRRAWLQKYAAEAAGQAQFYLCLAVEFNAYLSTREEIAK